MIQDMHFKRSDPSHPQEISKDSKLELYWRPGCPFCALLKARLKARHIHFTQINIWENQQAAAFVRSVAGGNETVPTVTINQQTFVNPSIKQITRAINKIN